MAVGSTYVAWINTVGHAPVSLPEQGKGREKSLQWEDRVPKQLDPTSYPGDSSASHTHICLPDTPTCNVSASTGVVSYIMTWI